MLSNVLPFVRTAPTFANVNHFFAELLNPRGGVKHGGQRRR